VIDTRNATTLEHDGLRISQVEHLLAALSVLQLDNVQVDVEGSELPVLDGSARPWREAILDAGLRAQSEARKLLTVPGPLEVRQGKSWARVEPAEGFALTVSIDFPHPEIGRQEVQLDALEHFLTALDARTFCLLAELEGLRQAGLIQGGSIQNALVMGEAGWINPELCRLPLEPAWHKALDALGDLALLGGALHGRLHLHAGGHRLHAALVQVLESAICG
jgi:UDP-3-O-[3-hydroxymyristoyl] N-acetylglucosamine deacetylase